MGNNNEPNSSKAPMLFDKIKEDMLMEVVESALPKIKPFLEPAMQKLNEWLGDDSKLIVIKRNKNASTKVIIFDNTKGEFEIKSGKEKVFTADKESIIGVYDVDDFISKLISGDISKLMG